MVDNYIWKETPEMVFCCTKQNSQQMVQNRDLEAAAVVTLLWATLMELPLTTSCPHIAMTSVVLSMHSHHFCSISQNHIC